MKRTKPKLRPVVLKEADSKPTKAELDQLFESIGKAVKRSTNQEGD